MFTKRIPDTAVTSEDLSHTTITKIFVRKITKKKKNLTKTNIGTIVIAKFHKMTKISYYRICTMRYNILHFQSPTSGYALHVCDTIYYTVN